MQFLRPLKFGRLHGVEFSDPFKAFSLIATVILFSALIFRGDNFSSRWAPYLYGAVLINFLLYRNSNINAANSKKYTKSGIIFFLVFLTSFATLLVQQMPVEQAMSKRQLVLYLTFVSAIGLFASTRRSLKAWEFKLLVIAAITLTFATTRNSWTLFSNLIESPILVLPILLATSLLFIHYGFKWSSIESDYDSQRPKPFALGLLLAANMWLAFRVDQINEIPGSYFHFGYYSEVVRTLNSGGTLLWDTPSQYGFLNILIPSLIPIDNSRQAVYLFQGLLIFFVVAFLMYAIYKKAKSQRSFLVYGSGMLIIYFFADPNLIGPQLYPSSSAMRFAPSAMFIIAIQIWSWKSGRSLFSLPNIVFTATLFSVLWSAEAAVYALSIIFSMLATQLGPALRRESSAREHLLKIGGAAAIGVTTAIGLMCLYVFLGARRLPDFSMFFMYARGYSEGFGSYPLTFVNPAWLVILLISLAIANMRGMSSESILKVSALVGGLIGWSSYYVGRAVSDNIIALFPLIAMVAFFFATEFSGSKRNESSVQQDLNIVNQRISITATSWLIALVVASIVTQPQFVGTFLGLKSLNAPTVQTTFLADEELIKLLSETEIESDLPIAFHGFVGMLPRIPKEANFDFAENITWIPVPLGLLEEPISSSKQEEVLNRFFESSKEDGVLVRALTESFPDRQFRLKRVIEEKFNCSTINRSQNYSIEVCRRQQ
jgi:hypothetical protein